jgi:Na+-translocating ferredoxin:NAD+ oxidoreductase subunit B
MSSPPAPSLTDRIHALLPQTQCTKCGFDGCRPYAEAIAAGDAGINQCPPGGGAGIAKLAALTGRQPLPLNPANGSEQALRVAIIDEPLCIGCTLCIQACPVDAIIGAPRRMHSVIAEWCNGCDLCIAPCPTDCIVMVPVQPDRAWTEADAHDSRARYEARRQRLAAERKARENQLLIKAHAKLGELEERHDLAPDQLARKQAVVRAAIERARARRQAIPKP